MSIAGDITAAAAVVTETDRGKNETETVRGDERRRRIYDNFNNSSDDNNNNVPMPAAASVRPTERSRTIACHFCSCA